MAGNLFEVFKAVLVRDGTSARERAERGARVFERYYQKALPDSGDGSKLRDEIFNTLVFHEQRFDEMEPIEDAMWVSKCNELKHECRGIADKIVKEFTAEETEKLFGELSMSTQSQRRMATSVLSFEEMDAMSKSYRAQYERLNPDATDGEKVEEIMYIAIADRRALNHIREARDKHRIKAQWIRSEAIFNRFMNSS